MSLQEQITNYKMSDVASRLIRNTSVLLIASIAGGGKDTVVNELLKRGGYHRIISHTTRAPRNNNGQMEQDGVEYHFISNEQVGDLINDKAFIEVKYNHGRVYGTCISEFQEAHDKNLTAVTDVDIKGVAEYLSVKPDTHAIFLLPPSVETWLERLERRYGDLASHEEELKVRFKTAYDEINYIKQDYRFILIVNDDLETTVQRVRGVIDGVVDHSSEYATEVADHILDYLETKI